MGDARIEAVASLLHERAPREVPRLREPPRARRPSAAAKRAPGHAARGAAGHGGDRADPPAVERPLRRRAARQRRRREPLGTLAITRSRDDALRDAHGSFFYLRWDRQPRRGLADPASRRPTRRRTTTAAFHADRVCFDAAWSELRGDDDGLGQPRGRHRVPPGRPAQLRRAHARPRAAVVVRGHARRPARRRSASGVLRTCSSSAEWQAAHQALVFERKPRLATDKGLRRGALPGRGRAGADAVRLQVDRQRWLGRNRDASHPLAAFDELPVAPEGSDERAARHRPRPGRGVRGAPADRAQRQGAADLLHRRRRQRGDAARGDRQVPPARATSQRASLMSATLAGIRLREMRISAENFAAIQTLTTAAGADARRAPHCARAEASRRLRPAPALALRHLGRPADRPRLGRRRARASACCARWRRRCACGRGAASPATWSSSTPSRRRT